MMGSYSKWQVLTSSFSEHVPVKFCFWEETPVSSADGFWRLKNVWVVQVIKILVIIPSCCAKWSVTVQRKESQSSLSIWCPDHTCQWRRMHRSPWKGFVGNHLFGISRRPEMREGGVVWHLNTSLNIASCDFSMNRSADYGKHFELFFPPKVLLETVIKSNSWESSFAELCYFWKRIMLHRLLSDTGYI